MGKRQRKSKGSKQKTSSKNVLYPAYQIISFSMAVVGFGIIAWYGFNRGNPFPYASFIGAGLVTLASVLVVIFDKSKWSKNRSDYPDNLGGHDGGAH